MSESSCTIPRPPKSFPRLHQRENGLEAIKDKDSNGTRTIKIKQLIRRTLHGPRSNFESTWDNGETNDCRSFKWFLRKIARNVSKTPKRYYWGSLKITQLVSLRHEGCSAVQSQ